VIPCLSVMVSLVRISFDPDHAMRYHAFPRKPSSRFPIRRRNEHCQSLAAEGVNHRGDLIPRPPPTRGWNDVGAILECQPVDADDPVDAG